jgi:hypothetical protein
MRKYIAENTYIYASILVYSLMKFITFILAIFITTGVTVAGNMTGNPGRGLLYVALTWGLYFLINRNPRKY